MKYLILFMVLLFAFFAIPCFLPSHEAYERARQDFSAKDIEDARRFTLQRQLLFWPPTILQIFVLTFLAYRSRRLADACSRWVRGRWLPTVLLVGLTWTVLEEAVRLPFAIARLENSRAWGLTSRSVWEWLGEHFMGLTVFGGIEALVLVGFYLLLRYLPRTWWLACSVASPLLAIAGVILHPLVLAPLFNTFEPLEQSKWKSLKPKIDYLLNKAGVNVSEILVMNASKQGGHTNAYFTGFGSSRRIVLYDTLLEDHKEQPAELESILAHELGHWLHDHIIKGIILASIGAFFGLLLLFLFLKWMVGRAPCYLKNAADPAGLPWIILAVTLANWVTMPAQNVFSRYIERQADEESLKLAGQPEAFIAAEKRMALKNISQLDPHPLRVFLYYTHPPVTARIEMAEEWERTHK